MTIAEQCLFTSSTNFAGLILLCPSTEMCEITWSRNAIAAPAIKNLSFWIPAGDARNSLRKLVFQVEVVWEVMLKGSTRL